MSCHPDVDEWPTISHSQLPRVSQPPATVLALWSLGMVLARSGALSAVGSLLATRLQRQAQHVRQPWHEWGSEAAAKRGAQRQALKVEDGFGPLWRWGLSRWPGLQLALALEATTLGPRFTVLAVRVVSRGWAIPVAGPIWPANTTPAWRRHWRRLLRQRRPALPPGGTVSVLADRGLAAGWLCRRMVRLGWHPVLRINLGGPFRPDPQATSRPLASFVPQPGPRWRGPGPAVKSPPRRRPGPLLAGGEAGDTAPWLILPTLPPAARAAGWSGLRAWIEPGFKVTKRAGWPWQRPRMPQPERAARRWLAVAVAPLWLRSVGGVAEATIPASTRLDVSDGRASQRRQRRATRRRLVSVFRRGWSTILVAWLNQRPLPLGGVLPEPWPLAPATDGDGLITDVGAHHHAAA